MNLLNIISGVSISSILIAFGILLFGKGKKSIKVTKTLGIIGVIGLLSFIPAIGDSAPFLSNQIDFGGTGEPLSIGGTGDVVETPSGEEFVDTGFCQYDGITATISSINAETSVPTGGTHRVIKNNAPATTVADGGTLSVSNGDIIKIFYGNGTDGTYFGELKTFQIDCKTKYPTLVANRYQNGTLNFRVYNTDKNLIDGGVTNQTLTNGDLKTLALEMEGTYQRGLPHGGIIVAEFGSEVYDDVKITDKNGVAYSKAEVPSFYPSTFTNNRTIAYNIPAIISNQQIDASLVLDVDDTNNPGTLQDVVLTYYPKDYFVNEDTGGSFDGPSVEDEDNAQTFSHSTATTVHVI